MSGGDLDLVAPVNKPICNMVPNLSSKIELILMASTCLQTTINMICNQSQGIESKTKTQYIWAYYMNLPVKV